MLEKQRLLNTYVNNVTLDETLDEIDELIHKRKKIIYCSDQCGCCHEDGK